MWTKKTDEIPVLYGVDVYSSSCAVCWAVDRLCKITVSVDIDFPSLSSDEVTMLKVLESVTTGIDDVNDSVNDDVAIWKSVLSYSDDVELESSGKTLAVWDDVALIPKIKEME